MSQETHLQEKSRNSGDYSQVSQFSEPTRSVSALMWAVVLALLPGVVTSIYFFGIGVLLQFSVALIAVLASDELVKKFNQQTDGGSARDGTGVVLASIVAISMPPLAPWWICGASSIVANLLGKHLYGGTGQNFFNPAMVGVLFALICFPTMSAYWPSGSEIGGVTSGEIFRAVFAMQGNLPDAISGATLLEYERTQLSFAIMRSEFTHLPRYGLLAEQGWQWVNLAYFIGGLSLCVRRVIPWVVPTTLLGTVFILASIFHGIDETRYAGPLFHCFSGAIIFCAFFVATDPVSSPTGHRALAVYAMLIGVLIFVFRHAGGYPEGIAFAVILGNGLSPLLDRLFVRQIYGH